MRGAAPMPSARRRPIPGMASHPAGPPPPAPPVRDELGNDPQPHEAEPLASSNGTDDCRGDAGFADGQNGRRDGGPDRALARRPAADYASTRLVNFRIPVDLHDRFRGLVREVELNQQRLRRPSLTELMIALLEEGPQTADEVAELIRRKRAAEHGAEGVK